MKVTIQDIANMVGVSKSTVSRYLNGGYVSEDTANKISEAVEKTGYRLNFFAKRLKSKNSGIIGVVISRFDSYTAGKILKSLNKSLEEKGYQILILSSELDKKKELECIEKLYQQGVDGIVVMSFEITKDDISMSNKINIPIVYMGQSNNLLKCVKLDDRRAGRILGDYIRDQGHRDIVFLGVNEKDKAVGVERKEGFFEAFNNIDCNITFVETDFSFNKAYEVSEEVIKQKPTAVIGATDNIILGFVRYAFEKGYSIPEDFSVAGFGGYDVGLAVHPTITTVNIDYEAVGKKAADVVVASVELDEFIDDKEIKLELIKRHSVRKVD